MRVGRSALDEEAIRLLEQHNPDVEFDWTRMLTQPMVMEGQGRSDSRDGRDARDRRSQKGRGGLPPRPVPPSPPASPAWQGGWAAPAESTQVHNSPETDAVETSAVVTPEVDTQGFGESPEPEPVELLDAGEPEPFEPPPSQPLEGVPESAVSLRLGAEGLIRLRGRYAEVMARIAERPLEDEAREQLNLRAERLNPDAWVTSVEVTAALEQYETVFEELRAVVGRHPRRRRK